MSQRQSSPLLTYLMPSCHKYIHKDQTGLIPPHNITDNIRRTLNLILYGKKQSHNSVVLVLDTEKAFDMAEVNYDYISGKKCSLVKNFLPQFKHCTHHSQHHYLLMDCTLKRFHSTGGPDKDVCCPHCSLHCAWKLWPNRSTRIPTSKGLLATTRNTRFLCLLTI